MGSPSVPGGCGAAAASLRDPACTPGTPQFNAAKKENEGILAVFRKYMVHHKANGSDKADMKATKEVKATVWPHPQARVGIYGHIPGGATRGHRRMVAVGDVFEGRAELDVLALHTQAVKGIDQRKQSASGAVAVVLSGGYKDNEDTGERFVYTGAGGQDAKTRQQVEDQSYEYPDNAALMLNMKTGTPVRVFRQGSGTPPTCTYEGLYKVIGHRMEKSSDGPKVIRFILQGVPAHFAVSGKVEFKPLSCAKAFQKRQLAGAGEEVKQKPSKVPKGYVWCFEIPTRAAIKHDIQQRKESGSYGRLVSGDISGGQEKVPIPVWNDLDGQDAMLVATQIDHLPLDDAIDLGFEYLADYVFTDCDQAAALTRKALKQFQEDCGITCGIQFHGGSCPYNDEGLLMDTHVSGLMECPRDCKGKTKLCKRNRVVSGGIRYPLEVFRVPGKGWGVRCSVDLPAGAVLCKYIGVVITDDTAEDQIGADTYFYDLNHFHLLEEAEEQAGEQDPDRNPNLPPMPPDLRDKHLTGDASHEGNVARFFNHSCDPNCTTQAVFTGGARSHELHYIIIVAAEDIPKFTELNYDYGSSYIVEGDDEQTAAAEAAVAAAGGAAAMSARIPCNCGAPNCRGWMKN